VVRILKERAKNLIPFLSFLSDDQLNQNKIVYGFVFSVPFSILFAEIKSKFNFLADGNKVWQNQERLPPSDLATLFSHFLDITTPASQTLLALLAAHAQVEEEKCRLQLLATV